MRDAPWEGSPPTRSDVMSRGYDTGVGFELIMLEQGKWVALYECWPHLFPTPMLSAHYDMATNRMLTDLANAVG